MDSYSNINQTLHDARSAQLRKLAPLTGTLLSAGCAGAWYFDWIVDRTGHKDTHLGLEYYAPRPERLPENVEWISNTVGDITGVHSASCDLVFSGQNLEHLWPEDVVGFLVESNRVLKPGGRLILDSPNRLLTEPLVWSHPEHTIEFTPDEAKTLAELGGFRVTALRGLWLCRDPRTKRLMQLDPTAPDKSFTYAERLINAENDPDNSFLWWLEAIKVAAPDAAALGSTVTRIFNAAWPERASRFTSLVGERVTIDGRQRIRTAANQGGVLVFGPYMPLKKGRYRASFLVSASTFEDKHAKVARCDVVDGEAKEIAVYELSCDDLLRSNGVVDVDFFIPHLIFGIQARCISYGHAGIECALPVLIQPHT